MYCRQHCTFYCELLGKVISSEGTITGVWQQETRNILDYCSRPVSPDAGKPQGVIEVVTGHDDKFLKGAYSVMPQIRVTCMYQAQFALCIHCPDHT